MYICVIPQLLIPTLLHPNDFRFLHTTLTSRLPRSLNEGMMEASFPTDVQDFDADERISFSRADNKFILVHDEDGSEFEFDFEQKKWVPHVEEEPLDDDDTAYGGSGQTDATSNKRKNGVQDRAERDTDATQPRPSKKQKQKGPPQPKQNTAVYVTGLPPDTTIAEVHELFSRKGGVIAEEIDSGAPRIKLYTDEAGNFKGDALIVFFKPQSVEMAIMLLDDTDFRITDNGTRDGRIRVQAADSSYKKTQYDQDGEAKGNGEGQKQPEKRPQNRDRDRQKVIKKTQKLDAKLADWDDDVPYPGETEANTKLVILRHMFTLQELEDDPAALLDIKEDIRDECSKLGRVTSVVLFDQEHEGIVTVKFQDAESAQACLRLMHGRSFDGRTVEAYLGTGREKFKRSKNEQNAEDSD